MAVATQRWWNQANVPPVGLEDGACFSQAATQRALLCRRINEVHQTQAKHLGRERVMWHWRWWGYVASPWHHLGHDGTMKLERNTKQCRGNQENRICIQSGITLDTPQISQEEAPITPTSLTTFMLHAVSSSCACNWPLESSRNLVPVPV